MQGNLGLKQAEQVGVLIGSFPLYADPANCIGTYALPPLSQRMISKPSGECRNQCQSAKKLEVELHKERPVALWKVNANSRKPQHNPARQLCCGYQQRCLTTGKIEFSKDSRHK